MVKLEIIIIIYLANANLPNQGVDIWWDILGFHLCCCSFRGSVNDRVLPEVIPRVVGLRGGLSCCPPNLMSKCFAFQRWLTVESVFAMSTSSREAGAGQGPGLLDTCHQHGRTCCWANFEYTLEQGWKDKRALFLPFSMGVNFVQRGLWTSWYWAEFGCWPLTRQGAFMPEQNVGWCEEPVCFEHALQAIFSVGG